MNIQDSLSAVTSDKKSCIQFEGQSLVDQKLDSSITKKLTKAKFSVKEEQCTDLGFKTQDKTWEKNLYGIQITLWFN